MKKLIFAFLIVGLMQGHTLWINATGYYSHIGGSTIIFLGWGHRFPVADFINKKELQSYGVISPAGKLIKLSPQGAFQESVLNFNREGYYIAYASTEPGFYTMAITEKGVEHFKRPMNMVKGRILVSDYYQEFAKAILKSGKDKIGFDRKIGLKMEIVLLSDPSELKMNDFMKVRVFFKGKPLPFIPVYATYEGFSKKDDFAFATETDSKGVAMIRVLHWGMWMIKAHLKKMPEAKLMGKCEMISLVSTISFQIK